MDDAHPGSSPRLLGDIGGTNAGFALRANAGAAPPGVASYPCSELATLQAAMRHCLGLQRLAVVNDITAVALSLPSLAADLRRIAGGRAVASDAMAVLRTCTGLGVSGVLPTATPDGLGLPTVRSLATRRQALHALV